MAMVIKIYSEIIHLFDKKTVYVSILEKPTFHLESLNVKNEGLFQFLKIYQLVPLKIIP